MSPAAPLLFLAAFAPAEPAAVSLIDAHGITVTAEVPGEGAATLDLTLSLTPRARKLL